LASATSRTRSRSLTAKARIAASGLFSRTRNARWLTASILDTSVQAKCSGGMNGKPVDEVTLIPLTSTLNRARGQLAERPPRSSGSLTPPTDVHRAEDGRLGSTRGLNFCANGCPFCHDGRRTSHTRRAQARATAAKKTIHSPWLRPIQIASNAKKGAEIHAQATRFLSQAEALFNQSGQSTYDPRPKADRDHGKCDPKMKGVLFPVLGNLDTAAHQRRTGSSP